MAFVDLLGFSAFVESKWGSDENPIDVILGIKEELMDRAVRIICRGALAHYIPSVTTFSDSFIIRMRVNKLEIGLCCLGFFNIVAQMIGLVAQRGFAVRGAIEFGPLYFGEYETIGPAFNRAYFLENKVAKISRVILGPDLLQTLSEQPRDTRLPTLIYRSQGEMFAVAPILYQADIDKLCANASVSHADRYEELQRQCKIPEQHPPKPIRPSHFLRARDNVLSAMAKAALTVR